MVRTWAVLYVALCAAGCYSPSYQDCDVSCAEGDCPADLECRGGVCRTPGATTSCAGVNPDDLDGDGVPNTQDNCPNVANADQANEDHDAFGDLCDPCPAFDKIGTTTMDANHDTDGDGVGDGCDPNPSTVGDKIVLFEGFNTSPPGATLDGPWHFQNGQAVITGVTGTAMSLLWPSPMQGSTEADDYIYAQIKLDATGVGGGSFAGLLAEVVGTSGTACAVGIDPSTSPPSPVVEILDTTGTSSTVTLSRPVSGLTGPIVINRFNSMFNCLGSTTVISTNEGVSSANSFQLGLVTQGISAQVDFLMVVRQP